MPNIYLFLLENYPRCRKIVSIKLYSTLDYSEPDNRENLIKGILLILDIVSNLKYKKLDLRDFMSNSDYLHYFLLD